jgi:hypothetical protein
MQQVRVPKRAQVQRRVHIYYTIKLLVHRLRARNNIQQCCSVVPAAAKMSLVPNTQTKGYGGCSIDL